MKKLLLFLSLVSGTIGCSKKNMEVGQDPGALAGFSGNILVLDEYESRLLSENAGVAIEIEGSDPLIRVVTNEDGNFLLPQLDASKDQIVTFSKPGFTTRKESFPKSLVANLNAGKQKIGGIIREISPVIVKSLAANEVSDTIQLVVNVSFPQTSKPKYIRFITSTEPDAGLYISSLVKNVSKAFLVENGDNTITIRKSGLKACGFESGDKVYMKAYGATNYIPEYVELSPDRFLVTSLNQEGKSDIISFSVP